MTPGPRSEAARARMRAAQQKRFADGWTASPETRAKISKALTGRKLSDATRQKMSARMRAFHAQRQAQGQPWYGRPPMPETQWSRPQRSA